MPKGHLLLCQGVPESQKVSAFLFPGGGPRVQEAPVRLFAGPTHRQQVCGCGTSAITRAKHESLLLSRQSHRRGQDAIVGYVKHVSADSAPVPTGFREQLEEEQPLPSPTVGVLGSGARLTQPPDCSVGIQTDGSPTDGAEAAAGCCSDSAHGSSLPMWVILVALDCRLALRYAGLPACWRTSLGPLPSSNTFFLRHACGSQQKYT